MMLMNAMHDFEIFKLKQQKFLIPLNFQNFENLGMLQILAIEAHNSRIENRDTNEFLL